MISKPTTPQLIEAVCVELETKVAPTITESTAQVALAMATAVLRGAAVRSANELAWMKEEADAIEQAADGLVGSLPDSGALAEALEDYRAKRSGSLYLQDALDDYARASEVLSRAVEAAYADGNPARKAEVAALMTSAWPTRTASSACSRPPAAPERPAGRHRGRRTRANPRAFGVTENAKSASDR